MSMMTDDCQAELTGNILRPSPKSGSLDNQPSIGKSGMWHLLLLSGNYFQGVECVCEPAGLLKRS